MTMWQKGWNLTENNFIDKLSYGYGLDTTGNELRNKLFKVSAGMRIGEICALTWEDIDAENGIIRIRRPYNALYN